MVKRKNKVVNQLRNGIKGLMKQNKITVYNGYGTVSNDKTITISCDKKTQNIQTENVILANGSKPFVPELPSIGTVDYYTSDTIFDLKKVPSHMVIVGGGVIGLEIACIFNSLDTKVEIIEMAERILPSEDADAAGYLSQQLTKKGITIHTSSKITGFKNDNGTIVEMEKGSKKASIKTDNVLVSVGRTPNLTGLEELSVKYDGKFVKVDKNMRTSMPGIYAVGDLIGGYQLAHAATDEGIKAVNHILGNENNKNSIIPRCVYTFPELASVGLTEFDAKKAGYSVKVEKVNLATNGKAIAAGENSGFMKIIAEEKYGEILGVVMVGSHVTEMISQATSYMHLEGTVDELENMVFPHPTLSESLFETAESWLDKRD